MNVGSTERDHEAKQRADRVMRILRHYCAKEGGAVNKKILLHNRAMDLHNFNQALLTLIESGQVECFDRKGVRVYPKKVEQGLRFRPFSD